jgi:hypothetical protein
MPFCPQHWDVYCELRRERLPGLDLLGAVAVPEMVFDRDGIEEVPDVRAAIRGGQPVPQFFNESTKGYTARRKLVVEMYGGRCVCCGEDDPMLLDLDHVYGRGNLDRGLGIDVLQDAIERFREGKYRLLCAYCHRTISRRGRCEPRTQHVTHAGANRERPAARGAR